MINTWLQLVWKFENSTSRDYTDKDWNEKKAYTLWVLLEGKKASISTNKDPEKELKLENGKYYNFPVWTRPFEYTDKESWEAKLAVSFYIDNKSKVIDLSESK